MSKILLLTVAAFWILAGLAGFVPSLLSVMLFDAPGSTERLDVIALFAAVFTFPYVCWLSAALAFAFRDERRTTAYLSLLLPLINLNVAIAVIIWIQLHGGGFGR